MEYPRPLTVYYPRQSTELERREEAKMSDFTSGVEPKLLTLGSYTFSLALRSVWAFVIAAIASTGFVFALTNDLEENLASLLVIRLYFAVALALEVAFCIFYLVLYSLQKTKSDLTTIS
jgi:hypothetical protein